MNSKKLRKTPLTWKAYKSKYMKMHGITKSEMNSKKCKVKAWMIAHKRTGEIWSRPYFVEQSAMRDLAKYQSSFHVVQVEIRIVK